MTVVPSSRAEDAGRIHRRRGRDRRGIAGTRDHRRRSEVAQAQARGPQPADPAVASRLARRPDRPRQVLADPLRPGDPAGDVVADMGHHRRPRLRRIEGVERGDAVRLRGRHRQPSRDVVQGGLADPADPVLDGVEGRQQTASAWPGSHGRRGPRDPRCPAAAPRRPSPIPAAQGRRRPPRARRGMRAAR